MDRFALGSALLCSVGVAAQASPAQAPVPWSIDVQLDPTPLFLHGYAPELGLQSGRHRLLATVIAYDVPDFLEEDDRFDERRERLFGLGYQYFFFAHGNGLFAGATLTLTHSTFTLLRTGSSAETDTFKSTLRVGWMLHPLAALPHLFIAPWLGPSLSFAPEEFSVDGERIERRPVGITGAVQLGWHFAL
jgi:hypothetical protein